MRRDVYGLKRLNDKNGRICKESIRFSRRSC